MITPAALADYLETVNPRKCRGRYTNESGSAHCALGWAMELADPGSTDGYAAYPEMFTDNVCAHLTRINDRTPGWAKVIAYLRSLPDND